MTTILRGLLLIGLVALAQPAAAADSMFSIAKDPAYVTVSSGYFDFNRKKDEGAEFDLEYRSDYRLWWFKPFVHFAGVSNGMTFMGAGVLIDMQVGDNWIVQPSFAPTFWRGKTDTLDLGYSLEFRSRLEVAYRFKDRSRLGFSISHSSNASLGDKNPGTESLMVNVSIPTTYFTK